ncbi:MAG: NADP-dependent malic enzyme [Fidelibacterota bacterium]
MITKKQALEYHELGRPGKIEIVATKPTVTQQDLSLAYTPGVAEPCREIVKDPTTAEKYTARGNLVAVITNGTAVLGLGNIGPLAGKPVMEGKSVLFKRFSDIDVFDIELDTTNVDEFVHAVKLLEPTFGGINLEDIKAPECFEIEERLVAEMNIPVFHDDQHGTAIISAAGLINAVSIVGKRMEAIRLVISGAGAAALSCAKHYINFGVKKENIFICDSKGVINKGRRGSINKYKADFANDTELRTLEEALVGADVFVGLSIAGLVTKDMVRSMAKDPIVFALANPDPEISYPDAKAAREDVVIATGRSDYPNQVNNVLGFPFIFRGALDVNATKINDEMKIAASEALAQLAREDVPDEIARIYKKDRIQFGRDYIIPKPMDPRVLTRVASAVAKSAMESGVAREKVDLDIYEDELESRLGKSRELMREIIHTARSEPQRIVFPEGDCESIIRASYQILIREIAKPILLGDRKKIRSEAKRLEVDLTGVEIIDPTTSKNRSKYIKELYRLRQRKGITYHRAEVEINRPNYFGSMMVRTGDADGLLSGISQHYPDTIRPALQIIDLDPGVKHVAGMFLLVFKNKIKILADVTVNIEPDAEILAEIAILTADKVKQFRIEPRVALLSFSNFGSVKHAKAQRVKAAVSLIKKLRPDIVVDGEMHGDIAVSTELLREQYPFSDLQKEANVLIFPDLTAGNIAYKLLAKLANATAIGPILMGFSKPVNLLQFGTSTVEDIVHMAAITALDAQKRKH